MIRIFIVILLTINGFGAVFGGYQLMVHPDGSSLQLSMDWLKQSLFNDFSIPGVILFTCNGLFSLFTLVFLIMKNKLAWRLVFIQGLLLMGWILVQMLIIQTVHFFHVIFGPMGLVLMMIGFLNIGSKQQHN